MIAWVLLAAGASTRMGGLKALARTGGESFTLRRIRNLWSACDRVVVVLGSGAPRIPSGTERELGRLVGATRPPGGGGGGGAKRQPAGALGPGARRRARAPRGGPASRPPRPTHHTAPPRSSSASAVRRPPAHGPPRQAPVAGS